jgi:hypothetical protein
MTAYIFAAKLILAAAVIGYASWLSDKKPVLAGFIVALPLVSILYSFWCADFLFIFSAFFTG